MIGIRIFYKFNNQFLEKYYFCLFCNIFLVFLVLVFIVIKFKRLLNLIFQMISASFLQSDPWFYLPGTYLNSKLNCDRWYTISLNSSLFVDIASIWLLFSQLGIEVGYLLFCVLLIFLKYANYSSSQVCWDSM